MKEEKIDEKINKIGYEEVRKDIEKEEKIIIEVKNKIKEKLKSLQIVYK